MQTTASLFTLYVGLPRVSDLYHQGNWGYSKCTSPEVENDQQLARTKTALLGFPHYFDIQDHPPLLYSRRRTAHKSQLWLSIDCYLQQNDKDLCLIIHIESFFIKFGEFAQLGTPQTLQCLFVITISDQYFHDQSLPNFSWRNYK